MRINKLYKISGWVLAGALVAGAGYYGVTDTSSIAMEQDRMSSSTGLPLASDTSGIDVVAVDSGQPVLISTPSLSAQAIDNPVALENARHAPDEITIDRENGLLIITDTETGDTIVLDDLDANLLDANQQAEFAIIDEIPDTVASIAPVPESLDQTFVDDAISDSVIVREQGFDEVIAVDPAEDSLQIEDSIPDDV